MNKNANFKRASRLGFVAVALAANTLLGTGATPAHAGPVLCNPNPKPAFSVEDGSDYEINGQGAFKITLSRPACTSVKVHYATEDLPVPSAVAGQDYTATSGDAVIPAKQTSVWVPVQIKVDNQNEANETYRVRLSNPVGGTILDGLATMTIIDGEVVPG